MEEEWRQLKVLFSPPMCLVTVKDLSCPHVLDVQPVPKSASVEFSLSYLGVYIG